MKKIVKIATIILLLAGAAWMQESRAGIPFMAPPYTSDDPVATIGAVHVCVGMTTVDVPVTVTSFSGVGSLSLTFGYATGQLSGPVVVSRNAAFDGKWDAFVGTTNPDGTFRVSGFGSLPGEAVNLIDGDILFTLRFTIVSSAATAPVTFVENVQGSACEFTGIPPSYVPFGDTPTGTFYIPGSVVFNPPGYAGVPATVADLQVTGAPGAVIKWYAVETGGTPLSLSAQLGTGTHDFWASQTVNSCESTTRFKVTATVDPTPCAPTATTPQNVGSAATVANLTTITGVNIRWYIAATGGTYLQPGTPLADGVYYATQTIDCTESATRFALTVIVP